MKELPPTPTLRAFEAASRHPTFTAASAELNVTQSAVSHQIQYLEELWGMKLFERGRSLKLTQAGDALAPIIRQFLVSLDATLAGLRKQRDRHPLRISVTQSFASRWLLPRLPDLEARQPDLQLWIETTDQAIGFGKDEPDIAIRLGTGQYPGLFAELLMHEYIFPVASPSLLATLGTPDIPADLLRYPLLFRAGPDLVPKWDYWFKRAGVDVSLAHAGTYYPDTNMTIEAALAGYGVTLVRSGHVEKELKDGRLVRLLDVRYPSPLTYYFVCPKGRERMPAVLAFKEWIIRQAQQAQAAYDLGNERTLMDE
jgi:LysR family transcriptional regulator, glycine cleavage system transcriptional activator